MILRIGSQHRSLQCFRRRFSSHGIALRIEANGRDLNGHELAKSISQFSKNEPPITEADKVATRRESISKFEQQNRVTDLQKYQTRRWKAGDIYAPHDLSPVEMTKWKWRKNSRKDAFDALGLNPLHEYKNPSIMWEFTTAMGRIKHRNETGLRPVNQRRIAKAIRRAVGMGLMPSVHNHPEVLEEIAKKSPLKGR